MKGVGRAVVLLTFVLLFVNPCVPERAEREKSLDLRVRDDGGSVKPQDDTPPENPKTLTKPGKDDGAVSDQEGRNNDVPSVRFAVDLSAGSLE